MSVIWFSPSSVHAYSREQVAWIIREAWNGWPPQPSGYIDAHLDVDGGSVLCHQPDVNASDVIAEISARLKTTREAGEALIDELQNPNIEFDLWHYDHFSHYLSGPARRALNYLSGTRRRLISYSQWKYEQGKRRR